MIEGTDVRLRPWRNEDLAMLTELRNDILVQAQLLARPRGNRPEEVLCWLQSQNEQMNRLFFIIASRENDQVVGFIQITDLDHIDGHANLGICLISQARGRGIGSQAIALVIDYLRDHWRLRKLYLRVRADNTAAIRCYEKVGFERCGLLRQHCFHEGRWLDVVLMERFLMVAV